MPQPPIGLEVVASRWLISRAGQPRRSAPTARRAARGRPAATLLALLALFAGGCLEDLARQFIPVVPGDSEPGFVDAGISYDGPVPTELTVLSLSPSHGPFSGGTEVTVYGSGFSLESQVRIGGKQIQVGELQVLSPLAIKVVTPPGDAGPADVEVLDPAGTVTLTGGYSYDPVLLDPAAGPTAGGTLVTLLGAGPLFADQPALRLGGQELTDVEWVSASMARGRTPPGSIGQVDLTIHSGAQILAIGEAFTYYDSADPRYGGMGGGPLAGSLTVTVLDWLSRSPVANAQLVLQQGRALTLIGTTDSAGRAVFTADSLSGAISLTAAKQKYETTTLVRFDAREVTVFLMPIIEPEPGPIPPGTLGGTISGHVLFGGATGVGSSQWKLVPEPKQQQVKRVYVYTTSPDIAWGPQQPSGSATIDFTASGATAWPFTLPGRIGTMALYAVAGLYNNLTGVFDPYAMGITRGVVVGPGDWVEVDVWVTIPLTEKVKVKLDQPPGDLQRYDLRLAINLGADGVLLRPDQQRTGEALFDTLEISRLPSFARQGLSDATFTVDLLLERAEPDRLPYSRAVKRAVLPQDGLILLDQLLDGPRQLRPAPGSQLQGNTLMWDHQGPAADLAVTVIQATDQTPHWRVISRGDVTQVQLPDPQSFGLTAWPSGPLVWRQWLARVPGFSFDAFNYSHLSSSYWDRWSFEIFELLVP